MSNLLDDFVLPDDANFNAVRTTQIGDGVVRYNGHDKGVAFRFFIHAEYNKLKSILAKCEIFDSIEMIEYLTDKKTRCHEMVTDWHRERYSAEYKRFKEGLDAPGTPLSRWPVADPAAVATLAANGIFSVEQLAAQPRGKLEGKYPAVFLELYERAQQYVAASDGRAGLSQAAEKLVELEREKTKQAEEIELLKSQLSQLLSGGLDKPRAGRPRKVKVDEEVIHA